MISNSTRTPALKPVRHLPSFASLRTIFALVLREMSTTYGRSAGGYFWAIMEPALGLMLLIAIFSTGFRSPPMGTNFGIFYASGMMPFWMFMTLSSSTSQALNFSRQLMAYPRVTFIDALFARAVLTILTQLVVSAIIFTVILSFWDTRTVLHVPRLINSYLMAIMLGFGVGALNSVLISYNRIWQSVWSVITRPLILISGVIFLHEGIPQPYRDWLWWNPLVHVTGESRRAFYFSYNGDYVSYIYPYAFGLTGALFGILLLRKYHRDLMER